VIADFGRAGFWDFFVADPKNPDISKSRNQQSLSRWVAFRTALQPCKGGSPLNNRSFKNYGCFDPANSKISNFLTFAKVFVFQ